MGAVAAVGTSGVDRRAPGQVLGPWAGHWTTWKLFSKLLYLSWPLSRVTQKVQLRMGGGVLEQASLIGACTPVT